MESTTNGSLDHRRLYRLPWSLPDNSIAWLEPTAKCNLACEGCYRANVNEHKSLEQISEDLDVFAKYRTVDGVSIAGGDPLTHPRVVDIVRMVKNRGWKPILNTNGQALNEELLRDLKKAGVMGFTFHVDSKQGRPHWKDKNEKDLNELRLQYAEMLARVGGISCAFNSTVYEDTLPEVPDLVEWAAKHIDIVHVMVFILYRAAVLQGQYDYYIGGQKIDMGPMAYASPLPRQRVDLQAQEIVSTIRQRFPAFEPCAYLNGSEKPNSFKWLLTGRFGTRKEILGYAGPKMMELAQTYNHVKHGRYLAYAPPSTLRRGRWMTLMAAVDAKLRGPFARSFFDPRVMFRPVHFQSIMIIQPVDILADGRQNMCDACPDVTVWKGRLAWSCRLEECMAFGTFAQTFPKEQELPHAEPAPAGSAPARAAAPAPVEADPARTGEPTPVGS